MPEHFYDPYRMALLGSVFWIFVAVVVVAALIYYYACHRERQKTIRLAIEKGTPIDAELIEAIDRPRPARPEDYSIGGYICAAAGIGVFIFAFFIKQVEIKAFYPLLGAGVLTFMVGGGLLHVAKMIARRNEKLEARKNR
jgi:hypothetical protein